MKRTLLQIDLSIFGKLLKATCPPDIETFETCKNVKYDEVAYLRYIRKTLKNGEVS